MSRENDRACGGKPGRVMITRAKDDKEPRDTLNRDRVVRAAMELADERGIEAVTMRELGSRLGVEAASLYNHVAGKDDLLAGMADVALSEIEVPSGRVRWKPALRRWAASTRRLFSRHPWSAGLIEARDRTVPSRLAYVDRVLSVLLDAGFSPAVAADAVLTLDSYVYGFERQRPGPDPVIEAAEPGEEVAREVLASIPQGAYPSAARVAALYAVKPFDHDAAFDFGLGLILDGLERTLDKK
jgi:AcrR family transcriptional regulator